MIGLAVAAVLGSVPRPARAEPSFELTAGFADQILVDRSDDSVAQQNNLTSWHFSVAARPVPAWKRIWIELGYLYGGTQAPLYQSGAAVLDLHLIELSVVYRAPVWR